MLPITDYYHHFYYEIKSNVAYGLLLTLLTEISFGLSASLQHWPLPSPSPLNPIPHIDCYRQYTKTPDVCYIVLLGLTSLSYILLPNFLFAFIFAKKEKVEGWAIFVSTEHQKD